MTQLIVNEDNLQREAFVELMKSVHTCIPGHILAFDPATQRAQVQIGIMRVDINEQRTPPPPIIDVPVCFPGDDWGIEYEIQPNCEGLIHFSQRCVDAWLDTGGIADNPIGRFHSIQDAFFVPGGRSRPNVITDFQNNGVRLRNKDGSQFIWIKNDGTLAMGNGSGFITMSATGTVSINGVTFKPDGTVESPKSFRAPEVYFNGVAGSTHKHTGVQTGGGNTGGPV